MVVSLSGVEKKERSNYTKEGQKLGTIIVFDLQDYGIL